LGIVIPPMPLHPQCGLDPLGAEAVGGFQHAAPGPLHEITAVQDPGDGDALAGGQHAEGPLVGHHHPDFGPDVALGYLDVGEGAHGGQAGVRPLAVSGGRTGVPIPLLDLGGYPATRVDRGRSQGSIDRLVPHSQLSCD
jgi:hypothetical protein